MIGSWGNRGSNSSVGIWHKTIGNQSIGGICKDLPDSMMARLVEHVRDRVIGEVSHWLVWGMEPTTQGNCNDELGSKGGVKSLQPDMPNLG